MYASLSIDLDNLWAYLKVHGEESWKKYPSYFPVLIPSVLDFFHVHRIRTTFFIVGQDAVMQEHIPLLQKIADSGHEFGNHSYHHEPWMGDRSEEAIFQEIQQAHNAIRSSTGQDPVGFRGPGFCWNLKILNVVHKMNYAFDASLLPTIIAPLARLYYLLTTPSLGENQKSQRKNLFGGFKNGFRPLRPFKWNLDRGDLIEIPVTTLPLFRLPIHFSYILWMSGFSKSLALTYFNLALSLCKKFRVEPSLLLHPLDFLGKEEVPQLSFFPGMNLSKAHKLDVLNKAISNLSKQFSIIPLSQHANLIHF